MRGGRGELRGDYWKIVVATRPQPNAGLAKKSRIQSRDKDRVTNREPAPVNTGYPVLIPRAHCTRHTAVADFRIDLRRRRTFRRVAASTI